MLPYKNIINVMFTKIVYEMKKKDRLKPVLKESLWPRS